MWICNRFYRPTNISRLLFFVTSFLFISTPMAQTNVVSDIQIIGNDVTKDYIIRREIQHPANTILDSLTANEDRDRLENLGIFSHVSWEYIPTDDQSGSLRFFVIESWRYLPGILPIHTEEYGWIFSGGLIINNFRGRNQIVSVGGEFGGRTSYGIEYEDPWIAGDHISFSANVGKNFWVHPYLLIDVVSRNLEFSFGRYFGYKFKTNIDFEITEQSLSDKTLFQGVSVEFEPMYDTRDLYINPTKGILIAHDLKQEFDITGNRRHRFHWSQSYSVFHALAGDAKKLVACANVTGNFLFGDNEHDFFKRYIGGAETVRGWISPDSSVFVDDPTRFGINTLITSFELRQTVIPRYATKFGTEFGLTAVGYLDAGVAGDEIENILHEEPMFGTGLGFRIPIAILQTLRFDYGVGYRNGQWTKPAFHFSVGQKF